MNREYVQYKNASVQFVRARLRLVLSKLWTSEMEGDILDLPRVVRIGIFASVDETDSYFTQKKSSRERDRLGSRFPCILEARKIRFFI